MMISYGKALSSEAGAIELDLNALSAFLLLHEDLRERREWK